MPIWAIVVVSVLSTVVFILFVHIFLIAVIFTINEISKRKVK